MGDRRMEWARSRFFGESEVVKCHWCPRVLNLRGSEKTNPLYCTVDHLVEKALGGSDDYSNLVPACKRCNSSRSSGIKNPRRSWKMSDVMWEQSRKAAGK